MRNKKYSPSEINVLNNNPNVESVKYGRCIQYKESFKRWAVLQKLSHPELSAMQIFEIAGFDRNIISYKNARDRIACWKAKYNKLIISKSIDDENYSKQNNQILKTLSSKFEHLITILGIKKK